MFHSKKEKEKTFEDTMYKSKISTCKVVIFHNLNCEWIENSLQIVTIIVKLHNKIISILQRKIFYMYNVYTVKKSLFYQNLTKCFIRNDLGTAYWKVIKILYANKI